MSAGSGRVAALDLGTNTFLALVAEVGARGELRAVHDAYRTPRLGEGLARAGRIGEFAMARGISALRELLEGVSEHGVAPERVRAVGTAVFRRAANAEEFVERARRECGVEIEVVSGEREGALSFAAAAAAVRGDGHDAQVTPSDLRVIDVGGGSTELAWAGGEQRVSAPVGAVVLSERHLHGGEAAWSDAAWRAAEAEVVEALATAAAGRVPPPPANGVTVALGGTAANLAALEMGLSAFEAVRTEGRPVSAAGARQWAERLRVLDSAGRRRFPVEPDRASILPAGLVCLAAALELLGASRASASGRGLRYGLAWKMLRGEA
jgi:exopolyphosphatase/guanosine-5'-triphosphate,3'-diphosphate pyrophosphatase